MRKLPVILLGVISLTLTSCPGDLDTALRQYGYTPVRPASTFWQPGAIVYIIRAEPLEVGYICTAKQVMGENYRPMQSPTLNADLARATRKAFTFSANYMEMIRGDTDMHDVKSIKMSLRNARLFEINDSDIDSRVGKIDPACMRHVRRRLHAGEKVTMINSALQADVVYTVQYDRASKLDSSAQLAVLQNLALKLGVEASALGGRTIEAKDLIWGVRDDETLVSIFNPQFMRQFDWRNSRLLDAERTPSLVDGHEHWHREPRILGQRPDDAASVAATDDEKRRSYDEHPDAAADHEDDNDPEGLGDVLDDGQNDGATMGELGRVHPREDNADDAAQPLVAPAPLFDVEPADNAIDAEIAANANLLHQAAAADGVALAQNYWLPEPMQQAASQPNDDVPPPVPPKDVSPLPSPAIAPDAAGPTASDGPAPVLPGEASTPAPMPSPPASPSPPATGAGARGSKQRREARRSRPPLTSSQSAPAAPDGDAAPTPAEATASEVLPGVGDAPDTGATPGADAHANPTTSTPANATQDEQAAQPEQQAPPAPRKRGRRPRSTGERRNSIG